MTDDYDADYGEGPQEPRREVMSACPQELCLNWTGMGCACQVYDLEPNIVEDDDVERVVPAGVTSWTGP